MHELHRYAEGVEAAPGRLDEVEERLALLDRLKRKHGGTIAAVLEHAAACRARHAELAGAEEAIEGTEAELEALRAKLEKAAAALSKARREAGDVRWPARSGSGWRRWRWTARSSPPRSHPATTASGRRAPTRSSS